MAGFKLIETYLSSESEHEEENTTHSEEIQSKISNPANNQCQLHENSDSKSQLPLPESIISGKRVKYDEDEAAQRNDQIDEHNGRIRSFKHERGNWATLVYVEYKPWDLLYKWMASTMTELPVEGNLIGDQCHISFTRTLILKFHWIDSFVDSLKRICRSTTKFTLEMMDLKIYCNEERTRTFMGIECQSLDQSFMHLMDSLNKLLAEYQLPPFYEDASYHISFLWTLGDKRKELNPLIPSLRNSLNEALTQDLEKNYIHVSEIHCKIGNKIYVLPLR